jgi:FixJ family two-component response regulator
MGASKLAAQIVAIVEDDEAMRRAIGRVLQAEGMVAEAFHSAEAFLASGAALRSGCLVLDVELPGMSGIDLYHHLRSIGNTIPTIFITAHDELRLLGLGLKGKDWYLVKPFASRALIQLVARSTAS